MQLSLCWAPFAICMLNAEVMFFCQQLPCMLTSTNISIFKRTSLKHCRRVLPVMVICTSEICIVVNTTKGKVVSCARLSCQMCCQIVHQVLQIYHGDFFLQCQLRTVTHDCVIL